MELPKGYAHYVYVYLDPRKLGQFCYKDCCFLCEPIYVGKGRNKRYLDHLKMIDSRLYHNKHLQGKLKKIVQSSLNPVIIIYQNFNLEEDAFKCEKDLVESIGRSDLKLGPLCNQKDGGIGGSNPSLKTREKLRIINTGRLLSEETKRKLSEIFEGHEVSQKTRKKLSEANKGKKPSEESKEKNRKAHLGRKHTEETKLKLSEASKGKKGKKLSEETKQKLRVVRKQQGSPWNKGRKISEETKVKIGLALKGQTSWNKGKKHSEEHKAKLKAAWQLRNNERKVFMQMPDNYENIQFRFTSNSRNTRMGQRVARNVAELASNLTPPIICVGCGDGFEIECMLKHFGISVEENAQSQQIIGLEVTKSRVQIAQGAGLIVHEGPAENIQDVVPENAKRNIYCAHCLEHCFNSLAVIENFKKVALDTIVLVVPIEARGKTVNRAHYYPIPNLGYIANLFGMDWQISILYRFNIELEGVLILKRDPMNWPVRSGRTFSSELLIKGSF